MSDGDDDTPTLSADTMAILNQFYAEKEDREDKKKEALEKLAKNELSTVELEENWNLSQFWYDEVTANVLATEALRVAGDGGSIACVSCPTLFKKLREVKPDSVTLRVFEYDNRFAVYGEQFVFYDFQAPLEVPRDLREKFDLVVADPPYLQENCLTKTAVTVKFLTKGKILLCTGAIMEELANRLLDANMCKFRPKHKNNLSNEFRCYANYNFDDFVST